MNGTPSDWQPDTVMQDWTSEKIEVVALYGLPEADGANLNAEQRRLVLDACKEAWTEYCDMDDRE